MRIVISYSKKEFDPVTGVNTGTGAARLASACFEGARRVFDNSEVLYSDAKSILSGQEIGPVDLLVATESQLPKLRRKLRPKKVALIAVNTPTYKRYTWLLDLLHEYVADVFRLDFSDNLFEIPQPTKAIDLLFKLGSLPELDELTAPWRHFQPLTLASSDLKSRVKALADTHQDILYFPGSFNVRKGASIVHEVVKGISKSDFTGKFIIQGRAHSKPMKRLMGKMQRESVFVYDDFVDFESQVWRARIENVKFAIMPSFEEGQADSVIQLMRQGIPVLMSNRCGFENQPIELVVDSMNHKDWLDRVNHMLDLEPQHLTALTVKQLDTTFTGSDLVDQMEAGFRKILEESDSEYPRTAHVSPLAILLKTIGYSAAWLNRGLRGVGL